MTKIHYSDLDEVTRKNLQEKFGIDGSNEEPLSKKVIAIGKILRAVSGLSKRDALWAIDQVVEYFIPSQLISPDDQPREISMEEVIRVTAGVFRVEYEDLVGRKKTEDILKARQMAIYILSSSDKYTLKAVGIAVGGRSPATISHDYTVMHKDLGGSLTLRTLLTEIKLRLGIIEGKSV